MPLPNLIGLGVQRSGTRSLWGALMQQGSVTGFRDKAQGYRFVKEARHFDRKGWRGMKDYAQAFAEAPVKLDYTPSYLYFAKVPGRVKAKCPGAKFLVLLRDPTERAISAYGLKWTRKQKDAKEKFRDILAREMERDVEYFVSLLKEDVPWDSPVGFRPLRLGLYAPQLKHWLGYFPASKFCMVGAEWFYANQQETVDRVLKFMEVSEVKTIAPVHCNQSDKRWYGQEDMEGIRQVLNDFYKPWNNELCRVIAKMKTEGACLIPDVQVFTVEQKETEGNGVLHDIRRDEQDTGPAEGPGLPTGDMREEDGS